MTVLRASARLAAMVAVVVVLAGVAAMAQQSPAPPSPVPSQSMSTTTIISGAGGTASCSRADQCGSCSISCPAGKAALCVGGESHSTDAKDEFHCDKPPQCSCR